MPDMTTDTAGPARHLPRTRSLRTPLLLAFALALLGLLAVPTFASAAGGAWVHRSPSTSPTAHWAGVMAYDAASGQTILFGGATGLGPSNETWVWDGTNWTQLAPATSPPARFDDSMAYDPATGQLILYGGVGSGGVNLNDTWTWDGTDWIQLSPASHPATMVSASMAYDAATGQFILFGGQSTSGPTNETWTWDGTNWIHLTPASSPPARFDASMAYDTATDQLILFGGSGGPSDLSDTWDWDGTDWIQLSPLHSPSHRQSAAMEFDSTTGEMVLFGGGEEGLALGDSWTWDGTDWSQETPASAPSARGESLMTFDSGAGELVLFGGVSNSGFLGDTWTYQSTAEPVAKITSPAGGATFTVGQKVPTAFECADAGGPPIESCTDSNGATGGTGALDTSTPGPHTYTVTAVSTNGRRNEASIAYTVEKAAAVVVPVGGSPAPSTPPPAGGWFGIKKLERDLEKGTAQLAVAFTGSGEVTLTGKGLKTSSMKVGAGISRLPIIPTAGLKAKLAANGKVKVTVTVAFKTAGNVWTKTKSVVLRLEP